MELANDRRFAKLLRAKHQQRMVDEAAKPLESYRQEELEHMRLNFFGFDSSYHVARYNFVHRLPRSRTPLYLATHRHGHSRSGHRRRLNPCASRRRSSTIANRPEVGYGTGMPVQLPNTGSTDVGAGNIYPECQAAGVPALIPGSRDIAARSQRVRSCMPLEYRSPGPTMSALFSDELWLNVFFAAEWAVRLTMIVVVPFRRSPEAAKGWLLLIFFEPTVGLILYGLIGRPKLPSWRMQRHLEFDKLSHPIFERLASEPNIFHPDVGPELNKAVTLAENLGELPILGGNAIEVLADYDGFFDRLIADIDAARDHVHLLFYIVANDAATWRVIEALGHAVERGVVCRIMADSLGSRPDFEQLLPRLKAAGILAEETMRIGLFRRAGRLDLRNHRKIAVIDGRIAYTGSQNLVDSTFKAGLTYEELNVRLAGPIALELQAVFAEDWYVDTGEHLGEDRYVPNPEVRGERCRADAPKRSGLSAREQPAAYRVADPRRQPARVHHDAVFRAGRCALAGDPDRGLARRRSDVGRAVADRSGPRRLGQRSYYEDLMEAGVRICRYGKRFLHAKCLTIDDTIAWIGSSNLDIRSFALNAEVVVLLYDSRVCNRLAVEQERYLRDGEMLELERWRRRSPIVKVAENLARF